MPFFTVYYDKNGPCSMAEHNVEGPDAVQAIRRSKLWGITGFNNKGRLTAEGGATQLPEPKGDIVVDVHYMTLSQEIAAWGSYIPCWVRKQERMPLRLVPAWLSLDDGKCLVYAIRPI